MPEPLSIEMRTSPDFFEKLVDSHCRRELNSSLRIEEPHALLGLV
jgi:hypothetical protein